MLWNPLQPRGIQRNPQSEVYAPDAWTDGDLRFRWSPEAGGVLEVAGIPGRPLPYQMSCPSPSEGRRWTQLLAGMMRQGRLPPEGVFRASGPLPPPGSADGRGGIVVGMYKGEGGPVSVRKKRTIIVLCKGNKKITGAVTFLTNKSTDTVFPVASASVSPKIRAALNTPKHREIVAKIMRQTTGERGGDYRKHLEHFVQAHAEVSKHDSPEAFAAHVARKSGVAEGSAIHREIVAEALKAKSGKKTGRKPVSTKEEKPEGGATIWHMMHGKHPSEWDEAELYAGLHRAVSMLAANDSDAASQRNEVGFNKPDSNAGAWLSSMPHDRWSPDMAHQAWTMLRKYHKTQLGMGGEEGYLFRKPINLETATPEQRKSLRQSGIPGRKITLSPSGEITLQSPYDAGLVAATKDAFTRRRFEGSDKTWRMKPGDVDQGDLMQFAEKHGFRVDGAVLEALNKAEVEKVERAARPKVETAHDNRQIGFGKYATKTFGEIAESDPDYLEWLSREAFKPNIKHAAKVVHDARIHGIEPTKHEDKAGAEAAKPAVPAGESKAARATAAKSNTSLKRPALLKGGVLDRVGGDLHDYQKSGVNWMETVERGILGDEMGLGKTLQAITLTGHLKEKGLATGGMMIVPNTLLHNWRQEIEKWAPGAKVVVIDGPPAKREAAYAEAAKGCDFILAPYSMVQREPEKLKAVNGPSVVKFYDEGVRLKGSTTQTHKNAHEHLGEGRVIIMTATPMPNRPEELFSLMRMTQPDVLGSFTNFKRNYCITQEVRAPNSPRGYVEQIVAYKNLDKLREVTAPFIRMKRRDDPDVKGSLPSVQEISPTFEMHPDQAKVYRKYAKQARDELREDIRLNGDSGAAGANVLTSLLRMRQVALTPELVDSSVTASPKMDEITQFVVDHHQQHPSKGIVVFSEFNEAFPILQKRLQEEGYKPEHFGSITGEVTGDERARAQDNLNNGRTKVLFVATRAGGEGLNLQKNANAVVHMTTPWNPALLAQATARVHRQGQADSVLVFRPHVQGGIDQKIEATIGRKADLAAQVLGYDESGKTTAKAGGGMSKRDLLKILGDDE